ncbi:MAG TPA: DUF3443 family protein [Acidobacteriaceae bacterium]|nr:DUF3443 family protein [Acidobacteriaceae bacterium]
MRRFSICLLLASLIGAVGCGSGSSPTKTTTTTTTSSGSNVLSIAVDGGPTANQANGSIYEDAAFATATVCAPGSTSNCVTINNLLVDTGSTGLRVFDSDVSSLGLPAVNASNGSPAYDCVSFVDGSYLWGTVEQADVTLGGETAARVPIQVISSSNTGVPGSCSNGGTTNDNTAELLGANGILGVGTEPTDCYYDGGSACSPTAGLSSAPPLYYTCSGSSCSPAFVAVSNQVTNPVVLFPIDNNGVIVELPAVSGAAASVSGSLVFGIGTESNNQLPSSATIFTMTCDDFTTVFNGTTYSPSLNNDCAGGSFIDSGSNALFFPDSSIPTCPRNSAIGNLSSWYCPSSTESLSATNEGANGSSKSTNFTVANAETLFTSPSTDTDAAMSGLAGVNPTGVGFDWGLPFFFGVSVYNAIDGQSMPTGEPAGPWWAY